MYWVIFNEAVRQVAQTGFWQACLGVAAIHALLKGEKNIMIGKTRGEIKYTPLDKITKKHLEITPIMTELINILSI